MIAFTFRLAVDELDILAERPAIVRLEASQP
jgi:hypothetical protein